VTWSSSKGRIRVSDMTDSHLTNTIGYLERQAHRKRSRRIVESLIIPSLSADNTVKDVVDADLLEFVPGIYYMMTKEAVDRGLWLSGGQPIPVPPYMMLWETEDD